MTAIEDLAASQESMANQLASMARELASMQRATQQQALYARLAESTPLRVGEFPGGASVAATGTSEPGVTSVLAPDSVTATELATDSVTSDALANGAIADITFFASTIRPPVVVGSLPGLPDSAYPEGSFVYYTPDGKLYRTDGSSWSKAVDGQDIIADSITAGAIAAGAVSASDIFGTTISGLSFHAGGSEATQITVYDSGSNVIGYWDAAGLHVTDGKFFMSNIALRVATSNSNSFWDFDGRAVRGTHGLVTFVATGAASDGYMSDMTLNGSIGVSESGRIYYRYSGGWHYSGQDAGFEIPAHETICPVCELPLLPGQDLIGRGDRVRPDGSLHGLYIHSGCAGAAMNQSIADEYDAVTNHGDLDADPAAKAAHESKLDKLVRKARKAVENL